MKVEIENLGNDKLKSLFFRVDFENEISDESSNIFSFGLRDQLMKSRVILWDAWGSNFTKGIFHIDENEISNSEIVEIFVDYCKISQLKIKLIQVSNKSEKF